MKKITVEEIELFYLMPGDESSLVDNPPIKIRGLGALKPELLNQDDVRTILITHEPLFSYEATVYYLYWNNGQDLKELDLKVAENNFTENDFKASIITRYQKHWCSACDGYFDALVIDDWNGFRKPGMSRDEIWQSLIRDCPYCGASLRQFLVKIFD